MLKTVFFDLDGTLLRIDEKDYVEKYLTLLYEKVKPLGYKKDELVNTIYDGLKSMYSNDGSRSNEEVFWECFISHYGRERLKDKDVFDSFYSNEFKRLKEVCVDNPYAKDIIAYCKNNIKNTILATNPFFPKAGQITRISFLGLKESDFTYITDYSNSCYCKPNPMYFKTLLERYNLKSDECIFFGNNDFEDGVCATSLGIKFYLVNGYFIHDKRCNSTFEKIDLYDIINVIKKEIGDRK